MKYKIGNKVRIIGNCTEHQYQIGEEVTIIEENTQWSGADYIEYKARNINGEEWYIEETDIEEIPVKPTEEQQLLLVIHKELCPTIDDKPLRNKIREYLQSKGLIDKPTEQ